MNSAIEKQMLRLLRRELGEGELDEQEARDLRRRIDQDPVLTARYSELEQAWQALDLPSATVPIGFGQRMVAAAARRAVPEMRWGKAPTWARAGAAAALVLGLGIGAILKPAPPLAETSSWSSDEVQSEFADPLTLAESYWLMLEDEASTPVDAVEEAS